MGSVSSEGNLDGIEMAGLDEVQSGNKMNNLSFDDDANSGIENQYKSSRIKDEHSMDGHFGKVFAMTPIEEDEGEYNRATITDPSLSYE